jgi:hypothetical protein
MTETKIQVGDWGTEFIITINEFSNGSSVPVDLSSATDIKLWLKQYNKTKKSVTGTLYTDGKDGKVTYTLKSNDLDTAGQCNMQIELTYGIGGHWLSNWTNFYVSSDPA